MTIVESATPSRVAGEHHHRHSRGADLAQAARAALEAQGEQWTGLRAAVFDVLAAAARPASAYDVAEQLSHRQDRRVAANSVYRILDLFVERNLVHRIESANAYLANPHPGCVHDCIFLLCGSCGQTLHLDDDAIAGRVRQIAASSGFHPVRPVLEVRGTCADCATIPTAHGQH